ncbi:RHS repeat-associated core domain-containing protein [bacterium]|nr:RHS repeat-associated core domain-containing protein [bacterium]
MTEEIWLDKLDNPWRYDAANRIRKITDVDEVRSYQYDANGNRISSSLHGSGYATGNENRLESDGESVYQYDNEGNLIRQTAIATGESREFEWDYHNRLIAVTDRNSSGTGVQVVRYSYDTVNQRLSKVVDTNLADASEGKATYFVYERDNVILDFVDTDGITGIEAVQLEQRYLHGSRADEVLSQENALGEVNWHLSDHLGSIRDLVDGSGALVNHFVFDSFGNLVEQDNSAIQTRYLYTGREFDKETEFYYYRSRYFNSDLGRFINEDTIGFGGGDFNLYRYVENNPIAFIDPFGRFKVELRYIPVAGVSNHVDVVVTNRNKTTSYWARAFNGGSIVEILGIGSSGDGTSSGRLLELLL